ncbi:MAG: hypothetical protein VYD19_07385, partial [Myxococcota bacterium]|nr:hypothetical protein [Myxococcota bacterium]
HKLSSRRQRRAEECVATFAQWRHRVGFSPFLASAYYRAGELAQAARLWLAAIDRMLWFGDQDAARLLCDLASLAVESLPEEEQHAARTSLHWGQLRVARRSGALHELTQGVSETMAAQLASAELFIQQGELIQAEQLLSALLAFSLRGGSDWCRVRGLFALCCYQRGAYEEAELFLEESVKVNLSGLSLSNQARLLHLRGRVAAARGQTALTLRSLLDAWRIAQSCGDWELSAGILQSLGFYYFETGAPEGLQLLERSQQLLCYASPARIASGEVELGRTYLQIGAFEKALGPLRRAETTFAIFSMRDEQAESRCLLGELSIELNQWSEAVAFFSRGLAQAIDPILKRRMQVGLGLALLGQGCVAGESSALSRAERCAEESSQEAQGFQLIQALLLRLWVRRVQQRAVTDRERERWRAGITEGSMKGARAGSVDTQLWEALCEAELALSAGDHMNAEIALEDAASALKYRHARLNDAGKLQSAQRWLERAVRVARAQLEGVPTPPHPILGALQS